MSRLPNSSSIQDLRETFREVWAAMDSFIRGNPDLHGRRLTNAGDPVAGKDYVTRDYMESRINEMMQEIKQTFVRRT